MHRLRGNRWLLSLAACAACVASARGEERPLRQVIDAEIRSAWQREKITPAGRADDATFLRRVYLDLAGTIPTADEATRFLADSEPKKREKLIDRLLADPRFAQHQADVWDLVLFGRNPSGGDATRKRDGFKKWLAEKFAKNEPYDRWVRDLLLAEQEGSQLFYVQYRNQPDEATVGVTRTFLGTQLQCARCHDHPFESWTQKDFYGMAGFFVRLVVTESGSGNMRRFAIGEKSTGEVLFSGSAKEQKPGRKGDPIKPRFLGGPDLDEPPLPRGFKEPDTRGNKPPPKPIFSRKEKLAAWLTAAENPYFARAAVNRVWGQFLGRGIVHPVDDLSIKNSPTHPALLQAMQEWFVRNRFDMKGLIRELVNSEAYQQGGAGPGTDALPRWFERARVRPLSAEELIAAWRVATGFDASARRAELRQQPGARLPGAMSEYVLMFFGEPTNGQGDFQGSLSEHLFLNNSSELRSMIQAQPGNLADAILKSKEPWEKRVDLLFLSVLSRLPRPAERERFVQHLTSGPKPEPLVEEAIWVLLNCAEFRFNH
jgi:hypothetical protein